MPRLVKACLDFIYNQYLEESDGTDRPYKLKKVPGAVNEIKECCRLLNVAAGGSMYDLKCYGDMIIDVGQFQQLARRP